MTRPYFSPLFLYFNFYRKKELGIHSMVLRGRNSNGEKRRSQRMPQKNSPQSHSHSRPRSGSHSHYHPHSHHHSDPYSHSASPSHSHTHHHSASQSLLPHHTNSNTNTNNISYSPYSPFQLPSPGNNSVSSHFSVSPIFHRSEERRVGKEC